jgi:nucleoside-triphosphatase
VVTVGTDPPATGTLATKATAGSRPGKGVPAVGNYIVDVPDFERIALDVLTNTAVRPSITVIDEVGKMELHSADFLPAVHAVMADETTTVLGTIPMPRYGRAVPAVEAVRHDPSVAVVHLKKDNRDAAADAVVEVLQTRLQTASDLDVTPLVPFLQEGQAAKLGMAEAPNTKRASPVSDEDAGAGEEVEGCGPLIGGQVYGGQNVHHDPTGSLPNVEPHVLLLGETSSPKPEDGAPLMMYEGRSMWTVMEHFLTDVNRHERPGPPGRHEALAEAAVRSGIAVWDVLAEVHVKGRKTKKAKGEPSPPNEIMDMLCRVQSIRKICFIGANAKAAFVKHFGGHVDGDKMTVANSAVDGGVPRESFREIRLIVLPSSSRANARVPMAEKVRAWKEALMKPT